MLQEQLRNSSRLPIRCADDDLQMDHFHTRQQAYIAVTIGKPIFD